LIATPPQPANSDPTASAAPGATPNGRLEAHHRHQSFTVIPTDYSPESEDADPNTSSDTILPVNPTVAVHDSSAKDGSTPGISQPAFSPGTFGAGVEEVPNPLEVPIVHTPEISQERPASPELPASPTSVYSNSHLRRGSAITTGAGSRYSAVPSFVHDFPAPPAEDLDVDANGYHENGSALKRPEDGNETEMAADESAIASMTVPAGQNGSHESAFGQVVTGPPGAGKTTYCHGMHQVRQPRAAAVEKEQWWA